MSLRRWSILVLSILLSLGVCTGQNQPAADGATAQAAKEGYLPDDEIQKEIDRWRHIDKNSPIVPKQRLITINRLKAFGHAPGEEALFLNQRDLIALASLYVNPQPFLGGNDMRWRPVTVAEVKHWPNPGATHVILRIWASALGTKSGQLIQVPPVRMSLQADGRELPALSDSAPPQLGPFPTGGTGTQGSSWSPESSRLPIVVFKYWFAFDIPPDAKNLTATVVLPGGKNNQVTFDASRIK